MTDHTDASNEPEVVGRAKGGVARAQALTPEQKKEISQKGVEAKRALAAVPKATHGSPDRPLVIGDVEIPCYVIENDGEGTRVLSQRGLQTGVGMSTSGGSRTGEQRLVVFLRSLAEKAKKDRELAARINEVADKIQEPLKFRLPRGGTLVYGHEATIIADLCDVILAARKLDLLQKQQHHIAEQCEILVRGFARVGIIALVDEATGYQRERNRDALAKVLEAFIAKELQPWLLTFPPEFYEEIFRLRGLKYPSESTKRPQYFGKLTNNIVYDRLGPGVKEELKASVPHTRSGRPSAKLFQKLTKSTGYPALRQHLGSLIALMKTSTDWEDFMVKVDTIHPKFTLQGNLNLKGGG